MSASRKDSLLHFPLPSGVFVLAARSLSCLVTGLDGKPHMLSQEMLTSQERCVVLPLLVHFPLPCPYEVMYASYYRGNLCKKMVTWSCQQLREARKAGRWGMELKPIRCLLHRVRQKLRTFDLTVSTILKQGYLLHYD